jgi:uncharacterized repeat protein (TIGR01451 family)
MKNPLLFTLFLFLILPSLSAQFNWQPTEGPNGGAQWNIWYNDNYAFYPDEYSLYRTNDGLNWEKLPESAIWPMAAHGSNLVGQCFEGNSFAYDQPVTLKVSHDDGETWMEGTLPPALSYITKLAFCSHGIYTANWDEHIIYRSQDEALTWDTVNFPIQYASAILAFDEKIYVHNFSKVCRTDTNGENWEILTPAFAPGESIMGMFARAPHILISTKKNLWHSHDDGQTWLAQNTPGLFKYEGFVQVGNTIFGSGGETGLAKSEDFGVTWISLPTAPVYTAISALAIAGGMPLLSTFNQGVFRWEEASQSFKNANNGLHSALVSDLAKGETSLWANTPNGVFRYDKLIQQWDSMPSVSQISQEYKMLVSNDSDLVCAVHQSKDYFYYSKDDGVHWDSINPSPDPFGQTFDISGIKAFGQSIFVKNGYDSWLRTDDFGQSWDTLPSYIQNFVQFKNLYVGGNWDGSLYISTNQGLSWNIQPNALPGGTANFFVADDLLFAPVVAQNNSWSLGRVYATADGINWKYAHDGLPERTYGYNPEHGTYADFFGYQGQYFMYHSGLGFYTSLDTAKTWVPVERNESREVMMVDSLFYSGGWGGGVLSSVLPKVYGAIAQGNVYLDDNNNGIQEINESPLPNVSISLEAPDTWCPFYMTNTKSDGSYILGVTPGTSDTLRPWFTSKYLESINPPFRLVGNGGTGLDFGIKLTPEIHDLAIAGNYFGRPRPGFDLSAGVYYSNAGTVASDATISVKLDNHLTYLDATPPPNAVFGDSLVWSLAQLPVFEAGYISVKTNLPPATPLGLAIKSTCQISSSSPDFDAVDNVRVLSDTVVGSFDPNEKRVEPADGLTIEEIAEGKEILYTIQFQNTGTYEADQVRITDLLDAELDFTTCRFVAASHPVSTFRLIPGGLLEIIFEHIMLPDSNTNEASSHGFVTFAIQRKKGYVPFYAVRNEAAIYFDFNEPILTNLVLTPVKTPSVSTQTPKYKDDLGLRIYPNPAQQSFTISTVQKLEGSGTLTLLNTSGQICIQSQISDLGLPVLVNTTALSDGIYFVGLIGQDHSFYAPVVVCHSK